MQLSYSSAGLLQSCARKYYHYKVAQTPTDNDQPEDTRALRFGKALHEILENTQHDRSKFHVDAVNDAAEKHDLELLDAYRVCASILPLYDLHAKSKLKCIACEIKIQNDAVLGYIDMIAGDENGHWWIVDIKTAASVPKNLFPRMHMDHQLNLYAYFAYDIAAQLDLDPKKFSGCRYRVATKTKAKPREGETVTHFMERVKVQAYDVVIKASQLRPHDVYERHMSLHAEASLIWANKKELLTKQNFNSCFNYFSPCKWWSQCHSKQFSECESSFVEVYTPDTMKDATKLTKEQIYAML